MTVDPRSRAKMLMRRELADLAFDHLVEFGYDSVSVDELARTLGISRATFFRYFESKEDIVVQAAAPTEPDFPAAVATLTEADRSRPAQTVFRLLAQTLPPREQQDERLRARVRMISTNPALGARIAVRRGARQSELSTALAGRLGARADIEVLVAMGFACLDLAWRRWASGGGEADLHRHFGDVERQARSVLEP